MKRIRRLFIIFVIIIVTLIGGVALWVYGRLNEDPPKLDPVAVDLVFMSDRDGDWDIYRLDAEGELHNLTAFSDAHEYLPFFTFDGNQISLYSTADGDIAPARVKVDGSGFETQDMLGAILTVLSEGQVDWNPVWSPGGNRIAWVKLLPSIPPHVDLFVADADGTNRIQLTDSTALDGMPAWSPDGKQVVYASNEGGAVNNIYVATVTNGKTIRLTDHAMQDYAPVWSTDGNQIMFIFALPEMLCDGKLELYVMNADGSDLHPMGADEVFTGGLTFAPDGKTVAYVSNESGHWHLYLMNADGSNVRQITEGNSKNLYPAWRPVPAQSQGGK